MRVPVLIPEAEIVPFRAGECFLQTSPELCMKRLLAAGVPRLFQLCHCFRDGESGRLHAPEFTMLEWYHTGWTYRDLMLECKELIMDLASNPGEFAGLSEKMILRRNGISISLQDPWQGLSVEKAFRQYASISVFQALNEGLFDEVLVKDIEPCLGWERPVFLYDYPVSLGSLARRKTEDPRWVERFELYIGGLELANGFSELVDSKEQRLRFEAEIKTIKRKGGMAKEMPEKFLLHLDRIEDAAGIALGFDRLFMLLTGAGSLREAITLTHDDI